MATPHKWKDVIIAWANGEVIQVKPRGSNSFVDWKEFFKGCQSPIWYDDMEYRIKPCDMITIGGVNIPAPLTSSTNIHRQEEFYLCDPVAPEYYVAVPWGRVKTHHIYRRLLHTKAGNAIAHTKALIVASGGRVE